MVHEGKGFQEETKREHILNINPLAPELFFLILAHPVYKM